MKNTASLQQTPVIHVSAIANQKYLGPVELEKGDYFEIVRIRLQDGTRYLVAGTACNTGLISDYAREWDKDCESLDEALQDFVADLENLDNPSGALLAWHGSLVI